MDTVCVNLLMKGLQVINYLDGKSWGKMNEKVCGTSNVNDTIIANPSCMLGSGTTLILR